MSQRQEINRKIIDAVNSAYLVLTFKTRPCIIIPPSSFGAFKADPVRYVKDLEGFASSGAAAACLLRASYEFRTFRNIPPVK